MLRTRAAAERIAARLRARAPVVRAFFEREALPLARAAREMAERFTAGGRLFAFGSGPYATDAAHVSVEFIHPVIVGKVALPAIDASSAPDAFVAALAGAGDMAIGFGPPEGDPAVDCALDVARRHGAFTAAWPGARADYAVRAPSDDAHVHQEAFEILGHTLYESVHVFLEHARTPDDDVGASSFLYPFLGAGNAGDVVGDVAASVLAKARDADALRERIAAEESETIAAAAAAVRDRLARGGRILTFGNGGSATDATDFALDCMQASPGMPAVPAHSLAAEPATLTAIANDVGVELSFLRQLVAHARPHDVAVAFSTSGGSKNVVAALQEARRRGLLTIALLGYDGGEIVRRGLADVAIVVRSDYVP
ncbi:MAG TPA: SIS domain-containing protein, partial [Candidatus Elarobacter sp.]|nr:SIS domain-containing protein [Candidatus Elarobacter sp.]